MVAQNGMCKRVLGVNVHEALSGSVGISADRAKPLTRRRAGLLLGFDRLAAMGPRRALAAEPDTSLGSGVQSSVSLSLSLSLSRSKPLRSGKPEHSRKQGCIRGKPELRANKGAASNDAMIVQCGITGAWQKSAEALCTWIRGQVRGATRGSCNYECHAYPDVHFVLAQRKRERGRQNDRERKRERESEREGSKYADGHRYKQHCEP